ncbi:MAG: flagellar basal-body MS-ring/collar protein FliF [Rubrivivax sp.]
MDAAVLPQANSAPPGLAARFAALPLRQRMGAAAGVLGLVAVLVALSMAMRTGDYKVLFANVSERDGGAIIERLTQLNVPYRFAEGSGTIMVPSSQVYDLRLKLSASGLPKGSITGYELLDKTPFGQTQGQERINLQRALEGELTRTIQSLSSVQAARVHLALPNQNGFFREQQKPSASVVLTLHPGRTLDRAQVAGIVHLVSSSVPELSAKAVSVIDGSGALLSSPEGTGSAQGLDSQQLQYLRDVEASYTKRVVDLLEPVLGRDNLRASVTADVDFSQTELTSEEYKPNQGDAPSTVRASKIEESSQPGPSTPAGVPGAQSNQPPVPATAPINGPAQALQGAQGGGAGASSTRREAETRYEVDKTVKVTRNATGVVRRLNAAVVVNHRTTVDAKGKTVTSPLPAEEIEKLTALVQQGIGFNPGRGDSVRVINAPFRAEPVAGSEEGPLWTRPWLQDLLRAGAAPFALARVALVIVFSLVRPTLKAVLAPPPPPPPVGGTVDEVVDGTAALPGAEAPPALEAPPVNDKLEAARRLAKDNPAAVANILRGWVNGEA